MRYEPQRHLSEPERTSRKKWGEEWYWPIASARSHAVVRPESEASRTRRGRLGNDVNDVVDGAHSAASECHRVVASKQTTLRGAVHGRG
jgi:hypothetical protein